MQNLQCINRSKLDFIKGLYSLQRTTKKNLPHKKNLKTNKNDRDLEKKNKSANILYLCTNRDSHNTRIFITKRIKLNKDSKATHPW